MNTFLIVLFAMLSIITNLNGQTLRFNEEGKLLSTPPQKIKKGDLVNIFISSSNKKIVDQKKQITSKIKYLDSLLKGETSEEAILKKELWSIKNTFGDKIGSCDTSCLPPDEEFKKYINKIEINKKNDSIFKNECFNSACLCLLASRKRSIVLKLFDFYQRRDLLKKIFCGENVNSLFDFTDTLNYINFKNTRSFLPDKIFFKTEYSTNDEVFSNTIIGNRTEYDHTFQVKDDDLDLEIRKVNSYNEFLIGWQNRTYKQMDTSYLMNFKRLIKRDSILKSIKDSMLSPCLICDNSRDEKLRAVLHHLEKYDTLWCPNSPLVSWITNWIWYSKGDFRLNYFSFSSKTAIDELKDTLSLLQRQENNYKEFLSRIDSLKNCLACKTSNYRLYLDTLKALQDSASSISLRKIILGRKMSAIKEFIESNSNNLNELINNQVLLHKIKLPVEEDSLIKVIYYDVSNNWKRKAKRKDLVLPDDYSIRYGFYNATPSDTSIQIEEKSLPFNDTAKLTRELVSATSGLTSTIFTSLLPDITSSLSDFFKRVPSQPKPLLAYKKEAPGSSVTPKKNVCDSLLNAIYSRLWRISLFNNMIYNYENSPLPEKLEVSKSTQAKFLTYTINASEDFTPPYTNKYSFKNRSNSKTLASGSYSIGRQKIISVGAGFMFNLSSARQQSIDTTNNRFAITNTDNAAKFVIGLKVYPFKSFDADNSLNPRFPAKRLSIFGGFEVINPLRNLYLGCGWDIVPGLHYTIGVHFYRKDLYRIENNQILEKSSSYATSGLYHGVTIDPIALVGILKFLFVK